MAERGQGTGVEKPAAELAAGSDEDAGTAGAYGAAKARALLRMLREDTGRDATTSRELTEWIIRRIR